MTQQMTIVSNTLSRDIDKQMPFLYGSEQQLFKTFHRILTGVL